MPALSYLLVQYGYPAIFFGILFGGEVLLLGAGFLAFLGYLNIGLVIILALIGVLVWDCLWYFLGRLGREKVVLKYGKFLALTEKRLKKAEKIFKRHAWKAILITRFAYGLRSSILVLAGVTKMKFFVFFFYNFLGTFVWIFIMTLLGFFFGGSLVVLQSYIKNISIVITLVILIFFVTVLISVKIKNILKEKIY